MRQESRGTRRSGFSRRLMQRFKLASRACSLMRISHRRTRGFREVFSVKSWHRDVPTEAGTDALLAAEGLAVALKEAQSTRCPLIVSKFDRLSRG